MNASWKIASMVVLPLSLALAGVGCVAQTGDEDASDSEAASVDEVAAVSETAEEGTGEAAQACGYGAYGFPGGYYNGWAFPRAGLGLPFGGCGFGGLRNRFFGGGFGCGGFGFGGGCF